MPWIAKCWQGFYDDSLAAGEVVVVVHRPSIGLFWEGAYWTQVILRTTSHCGFGWYNSPHYGWVTGTEHIWAFGKLGRREYDGTITFVSRRWPGKHDAVWKRLQWHGARHYVVSSGAGRGGPK